MVAQAVAAAIDEIYDRTGQDSILVTHSQGGLPGWEVPLYTDHVAAIVAIEPGGAPEVDSEAYNAMVEQDIPVTFYYGDYIGEEFTDVPAAAMWSMMAASADTFTEAYNAAGGNSTVVHLPDEGITGNDHFMFQDLNNDVIADHIEAWIQENVTDVSSTFRQEDSVDEILGKSFSAACWQALMALSLAACGSDSSSADDQTTADQAQEETTPPTDAGADAAPESL